MSKDFRGVEDVVQGRGRRASRAQYTHRIEHAAMRLHDDSSMVTWSAAVSLSFTITPRMRRLVTRSMPGRGGGGGGDVRLRHAEKTISVLSPFSRRLFAVAHVCRCSISAWHVCALMPGTTRYVSLTNLKIRLPAYTLCRSAAVTMYEVGPIADPWMTLAYR